MYKDMQGLTEKDNCHSSQFAIQAELSIHLVPHNGSHTYKQPNGACLTWSLASAS